MESRVDVRILETELSVAEALTSVQEDHCGAIVPFIGVVRNNTKGKKVQYLVFESYVPMAQKEMITIAMRAIEMYKIEKMAIFHRLGKLEIGEVPVIIAASSAHRAAAFEACEFAINTLKETVPIWKREFFEDGSNWVSATP